MKRIYPSLISADLLNLQSTLTALDPYCAGYHIDIMDDHFVPNLTWGAQFANAIAGATNKHIWVHLMIENVERMLERLNLPTGSLISIHVETSLDLALLVEAIKKKGWHAGLTLSPHTSIQILLDHMSKDVDQVLIMSVQPGFSGQKFIDSMTDKIEPLIALKRQYPNVKIAMDGGINASNIHGLAAMGVDDFAIASGIFAQDDPGKAVQELTKIVNG